MNTDLCDERALRRWLASDDADLARRAAVGIGRLVAAGRGHLWPLLRQAANDPRQPVRDGAAMGLRRIAEVDLDGLFDELDSWIDGSPLLRRAAVAGVTEPRLLTDPLVARRVTMFLERITWTLRREPDSHAPGVRALRQTLGSCWNVVLTADPDHATPAYNRLRAGHGPIGPSNGPNGTADRATGALGLRPQHRCTA
jgi:hypothetical protein